MIRSSASSSRGRTPTSRSCATPACARCRKWWPRKEPGPAASINKMFWSEYARDIDEWVMNLRGATPWCAPTARATALDRLADATSSAAGRARSGVAPRRCSATSSASGCSACPRNRSRTQERRAMSRRARRAARQAARTGMTLVVLGRPPARASPRSSSPARRPHVRRAERATPTASCGRLRARGSHRRGDAHRGHGRRTGPSSRGDRGRRSASACASHRSTGT